MDTLIAHITIELWCSLVILFVSDKNQNLNLRPSRSHRDTLTGLCYTPWSFNLFAGFYFFLKDSNLRTSRSNRDALTGLRYTPWSFNLFAGFYFFLKDSNLRTSRSNRDALTGLRYTPYKMLRNNCVRIKKPSLHYSIIIHHFKKRLQRKKNVLNKGRKI